MLLVGGDKWVYTLAPTPTPPFDNAPTDALDFAEFLSVALRPLGTTRHLKVLVDIVDNIGAAPDMTDIWQKLCQITEMYTGKINSDEAIDAAWQALPDQVRPGGRVHRGTRFQMVLQHTGHAQGRVLNMFIFSQAVSNKDCEKIATGTMMTVVFRPGPWAVKKAFHHMMSRLQGAHIHCVTLQERTSESSTGQAWAPSTEELNHGIACINQHCPTECDENDQLLWILDQRINGELKGWSMTIIQKAADNRGKGELLH